MAKVIYREQRFFETVLRDDQAENGVYLARGIARAILQRFKLQTYRGSKYFRYNLQIEIWDEDRTYFSDLSADREIDTYLDGDEAQVIRQAIQIIDEEIGKAALPHDQAHLHPAYREAAVEVANG